MTEKIFPTSFAQHRLWFLDQFASGISAYNLPRIFRVAGRLNQAALTKAFQTVISRHESLRTIFTSVDGEPQQVVLPTVKFDLPISDLSDVPAAQREEAAFRIARKEARTPFDLGSAPLLRAKVLQLSPQNYILVLIIHHIISDGWSMSLLFREIGEFYTGAITGSQPNLPKTPLRYSDFCRWQRTSVTGAFLADELNYWENKLRGAETVLQLPTDHTRPAVHSARGKTFHFSLSLGIAKSLKELATSENATPFMALLAAFQVLLARYTSQRSILIGTPTAGRNDVELENVIGLFVNTLILRADPSPESSFRQILQQARANTLDALAHQNMPFEKLVEALDPDRSSHGNPLFQSMFIFQNAPKQKLELPGLVLEEIEFESGNAKFDLTLEITDPDNLYCGFEYDCDLFEEATIRRMAGHFANLIEQAIATPDEKIFELPLLTSAEVQQFVEWNNTAREYPRELCVHTAFEEQVVRTPDKTALIDQDRRISYRQLNELANRLAWRLTRMEVKPGVLVGVSLNRSIEMVIALLGILKTGAAYVPLEPTYPKERLSFMVRDSQVSIVVTSDDLDDLWGKEQVDVLSFQVESLSAGSEVAGNISQTLDADGRMYVIYTSGSTGSPKGVEGTHRASMNRFSWMWNSYPFSNQEICCQKTPLGFVDSVWEIFGPLLRGVTSVILPDEVILDPERLVQQLSQHGVTRMVLVPSLLRTILDAGEDLQNRLPKLKLWSCSGEVLSAELVQHFFRELPEARLLNIYGSAEIAADVLWHEVSKHDGTGPVPIGKPISNVQSWILDHHLNRVPVGLPGELYFSGDCLALGYLGKPELTRERFIMHHFEKGNGRRLFRTGDFGRYLGNGEIEFIGRNDNQVKIRGMRVEVGEIEAALASDSTVRDAVVILTGEDGQQKLLAYITARPGLRPDAQDLRRALRLKLPDYMVPSEYLVVDAFPLLPSGKVDRTGLASQASTHRNDNTGYVAPQTLTEERLATIWRELLKVERVGIVDDFFDLGGHSLMVMQLVARIRRIFEVEIPIRSVFEDPTIKELANKVEEATTKGAKVSSTIISSSLHDPHQQLKAQIDKMSREELQELLQELLRSKSGDS